MERTQDINIDTRVTMVEKSLRTLESRVAQHDNSIVANHEMLQRQQQDIRRLQEFEETQQKIYTTMRDITVRQNRAFGALVAALLFLGMLYIVFL